MKKRTKEEYELAAKSAFSIAQMCRNLGVKPVGGNYRVVKNAIQEYNIDTRHFTGQGWNKGLIFKPNNPIPLEDILVKNSTYQSYKLKNRLLKSGLKEHRCENCKRTEWEGSPIPLELHHINGDNTDNRIENIEILCPNCHAQTEHYRGKNINARVL